jgi:hypothetical protein
MCLLLIEPFEHDFFRIGQHMRETDKLAISVSFTLNFTSLISKYFFSARTKTTLCNFSMIFLSIYFSINSQFFFGMLRFDAFSLN